MGVGFLSANRAFCQPETKVLMVTTCFSNKKARGVNKYDETQALASKLLRTRDGDFNVYCAEGTCDIFCGT